MATLLDAFGAELAEIRSWSRFNESQYHDFVNKICLSAGVGTCKTQFNLGLFPFIKYPRIEIYEVDRSIPLPEINQVEFEDVIEHYDFRRPWVMDITEPNGLGTLLIHSNGVKDALDFTKVTQLVSGDYAYSILRIKDGVIKIATDIGNKDELLQTFYWLVRLFHAKRIKGYFDVSGGNKKHKSRGIGGFGNVTCKISLSAKGNKYHYPPQPTQNPNYKKGKAEVEIQVPPFMRRVRCGKGRTQIKDVPVRSFKRNYWIVPRDKVTKIVA